MGLNIERAIRVGYLLMFLAGLFWGVVIAYGIHQLCSSGVHP